MQDPSTLDQAVFQSCGHISRHNLTNTLSEHLRLTVSVLNLRRKCLTHAPVHEDNESGGEEQDTFGGQRTKMTDFNLLWESGRPINERCFFRARVIPRGAGSKEFLFFLECFKPWYSRCAPVLKLPLGVLKGQLDELQEQIDPLFRRSKRCERLLSVKTRLTFEDA